MPSLNLEGKVKALVKLDEKELRDARDVLKAASALRQGITEELSRGKCLPKGSEYVAGLRETPGRVSYRSVVKKLVEEHPEMEESADRLIQEYRDIISSRLVYGRREEPKE